MKARRSARRAPVRAAAKAAQPILSADAVDTASALDAPPPRADLRAPMRDEDPRARASRRAAELRGHLQSTDEGEDRFFIDPAIIPPGWTYEWKRHTVYGAEDPAYQVQIARAGWEAVPVDRHPAYMPKGWKGSIERDGMILCERPTEIVEAAKAAEQRRAQQQMRHKEEQLTGAPAGHFERSHKQESLVKLKRSYEPMEIPEG